MEMRIPPHLFARKGVWYVKKVVRGDRHRESTGIKVGGEKELKQAIRRQREIEHGWDTEARGWGKVAIPTFASWWETYHATYSPKNAKPEANLAIANKVLGKWGRIKLTQITKSMCEAHLRARLDEGMSQGTVTRERGLLQAIFQRAIEDGLLEKNPFALIERVPDQIRDRVLEPDEQAKLHEALTPQFQRWLAFMLGTGLRLAEACAFHVEHLDRGARLLHVQAEAAKFGKARSIPLYPSVELAIDQQMAEMGRLWHAGQQNYRQALINAAAKAKIDHIFPHALRHTFATRYVQAGGNIFKLSKILGHASVSVTEKHYARLLKNDLVEHSLNLDLGLTPQPANVLQFKAGA